MYFKQCRECFMGKKWIISQTRYTVGTPFTTGTTYPEMWCVNISRTDKGVNLYNRRLLSDPVMMYLHNRKSIEECLASINSRCSDLKWVRERVKSRQRRIQTHLDCLKKKSALAPESVCFIPKYFWRLILHVLTWDGPWKMLH